MAKFELELTRGEKRRFMAILTSDWADYKKSLHAAERGQVSFESDEQEARLVEETTKAAEVLDKVLKQLSSQDPK